MVNWDEYGAERSPSRNRLLFPEHRLTTEKFVDYFRNVDVNASVLDVGCGDGFWMEILRNLGFSNLSGVDLSRPLLMQARSKGLSVVQCEVSHISFRRKFDIVLMCDVLEHVPDVDGTLNRVRGVLKDTGILYLIVPVYDSLSSKFQRLLRKETKLGQAREHDGTHIHAFSRRDLTSLLSSHHFQIERTVYTANRLPFISGRIQRSTIGNRFGNWLSIIARPVAPLK